MLRGAETFYPDRKIYGEANLDQGSRGSHAVWAEDFLVAIPDKIPNNLAALSMCGGATVLNALQFHGAKPTDVVGVIGFGGLGHLAIQFARAFASEVDVFSGTDGKKEEAYALGATDFHALKDVDVKELKANATPIDHLLVTTSQQPDWDLFIPPYGAQRNNIPIDRGRKPDCARVFHHPRRAKDSSSPPVDVRLCQ
jgi:D-arabinose 1-dehydrogenase-like Zn-dependent alcohol dehydrogenase